MGVVTRETNSVNARWVKGKGAVCRRVGSLTQHGDP